MKNIQSQYRDLLEGRMSKANFMRNLRMQFPQHISPVNSFDDSIKILKGKRILSEVSEIGPAGQQMAGNPDKEAEYKKQLIKRKTSDDDDEFEDAINKYKAEKEAGHYKNYDTPGNLSEISKHDINWDWTGAEYDEDYDDEGERFIVGTVGGYDKEGNYYKADLSARVGRGHSSWYDDEFDFDVDLDIEHITNVVKVQDAEGNNLNEPIDISEEGPTAPQGKVKVTWDWHSTEYDPGGEGGRVGGSVYGTDAEGNTYQGDFSVRADRFREPDPQSQHIHTVVKVKDSQGNDVDQYIENERIHFLNEAKKPEGVYGHNPNAENQKIRGIDYVNYYQAQKGIQYELSKMQEITDENYVKARRKAVETILKNPDAYKDLEIANFKHIKKLDKDLEMKEVKKDNHVDKANGLKVVKKDAPASANASKKESAKKHKVAQMTQVPKKAKGVEVMEVPGKEKVQALKEHILEDLMGFNEAFEDINKGSRVRKKSVTDYDAASVGNVEDFDGHIATVKWDNGETEHVQKNILTKKSIPQHPEAREKFGNIPDSPFMKKEDEAVEKHDKIGELKEKLVKALKKLKKEGAIAKTADTDINVAAGLNPAQVANTARGMEKQLGQQIKVVDTKTGVTRNV